MLAMNLIFNALACASRENEIKESDISIPAGFVFIKGGTFIMGSPSSESGRSENEVRRRVSVSAFYMSKYPVTQKEYKVLMGKNPSYFKGENLPVERVSWYDALEYCNKRSIKEGLTPAYIIEGDNVKWNKKANGYRLPTEAEWEYACRAGTTTPFNTGNNITTDQANYDGNFPYNNNAKGIYRDKTTPVGSFAPNSWGLYDMHGNVWEWCWDWYGEYNKGNQINPFDNSNFIKRINISWGVASDSGRVIRGGSLDDDAPDLRSARRAYSQPYNRFVDRGFRVVRY